MLDTPVSLHDVDDVEAFVQATINRARLVLAPDERDELVCDGLAIMHKLASDYQPQMAGHTAEGRFSGYAAMYLPRKLGDAWHRIHPEHQLETHNCEAHGCEPGCAQDGKRRWRYGAKTASLDAMTADDPDRNDILGREDEQPLTIEGLLRDQLERKLDVAVRVAGLLGEGAKPPDVAEVLGLTGEQVREAMAELEPVALRLRSLNQR